MTYLDVDLSFTPTNSNKQTTNLQALPKNRCYEECPDRNAVHHKRRKHHVCILQSIQEKRLLQVYSAAFNKILSEVSRPKNKNKNQPL
jgi:hypothetical protein